MNAPTIAESTPSATAFPPYGSKPTGKDRPDRRPYPKYSEPVMPLLQRTVKKEAAPSVKKTDEGSHLLKWLLEPGQHDFMASFGVTGLTFAERDVVGIGF
jgi:hypothetical protein